MDQEKIIEACKIFGTEFKNNVNKDELITIIRSLGKYITIEYVDKLFDQNTDYITYDKVIEIYNNLKTDNSINISKRNLENAFNILDKNNNKKIDLIEFQTLLNFSKEKIDFKEINEIFNKINLKIENNCFDYTEFIEKIYLNNETSNKI